MASKGYSGTHIKSGLKLGVESIIIDKDVFISSGVEVAFNNVSINSNYYLRNDGIMIIKGALIISGILINNGEIETGGWL